MLQRLSYLAAIVALPPAFYSAYGMWATLHPAAVQGLPAAQKSSTGPTGSVMPHPGYVVSLLSFAALFAAGGAMQVMARRREKHHEPPSPTVDPAVWDDVRRLSWYESFALRYLAFAEQTNGRRFYDRLCHEWGFPVLTLEQQNHIMGVFDQINARTNLLRIDPDSTLWSLRNKEQVQTALALVSVVPWRA